MGESTPVPAVSTFVVRLWHEWTAEGPRWRGCIEHVQSGETAAFLELDAMLGFLRCFGVGADDQGQPTREEGSTASRLGTVRAQKRNE